MRLAMVKVFHRAFYRALVAWKALAFRVAACRTLFGAATDAHLEERAALGRWRRVADALGEHRRLLRTARDAFFGVCRDHLEAWSMWAGRPARRDAATRAPPRRGPPRRGAGRAAALHALHTYASRRTRASYALRQLRNREVANAWRRWGEYVSQAHQLQLERRTAARWRLGGCWSLWLQAWRTAAARHRFGRFNACSAKSRKYHSKAAFGRWRWGTATARRVRLNARRALLSVCRCALRKMRVFLAVQEAFESRSARGQKNLLHRALHRMRRKAHDTAERTEEGERLHATMVKCRAAMRCRKAFARWQHAAWVAVCAACAAKQWQQTLEAKAMRSWRAAADAAAADRAAREAAAGGAAALKTLRSAFEAWGEAKASGALRDDGDGALGWPYAGGQYALQPWQLAGPWTPGGASYLHEVERAAQHAAAVERARLESQRARLELLRVQAAADLAGYGFQAAAPLAAPPPAYPPSGRATAAARPRRRARLPAAAARVRAAAGGARRRVAPAADAVLLRAVAVRRAAARADAVRRDGGGDAGGGERLRRHDAAAGDAEHAAAHGEARDARRGRPRAAPQLARVDVARRRLPVGRDVDQGAERRRRRVATEREFESLSTAPRACMPRTSDSHSHRATLHRDAILCSRLRYITLQHNA